jgi:hypothetical protein
MNRNWDDELSDSEDSDQNTFALNITSDSEDSIADSPVGERKDQSVASSYSIKVSLRYGRIAS